MSRDSFLEALGHLLARLFRRTPHAEAANGPEHPRGIRQSKWLSWLSGVLVARFAIWLFITGFTGFLAWNYFLPKSKETPNGPIVWNIEDNARGLGYFLNMWETQSHEIRVLGFQAHGKNITGDPIQHMHGYMRSDLTNAQIPIYLHAQERGSTKIQACFAHPWIPTAPEETYGIPAFAEFNVSTFEKPTVEISQTEGVKDGVTAAEFKKAFAPFTVVIEYEGGKVQRRFSKDEIERQFSLFEKSSEKIFNPLSDPYVLRKPTARPLTLAPLHPLIPLATPTKPNDDTTSAVPPKN